MDFRKFVLPYPLWGFDSENRTRFVDRSEWIMVKRDPALCELHNEDVDILCGWLNFGKNFVSLCLTF
jgi:hypothetical protein